MQPLAFIIFTVTSGPIEGTTITFREHCSVEVLEAVFEVLDQQSIPAFAQCEYGNGPLTSMRPVARPERD